MEEFIQKWIGTPYSLHNTDTTLNCWGIVSQYYHKQVPDFSINTLQPKEICDVFTAAFAKGDHGFVKTELPKDGDVIVFESPAQFHVGLLYKGKILHSSPKSMGVTYQDIKDIKGFREIEYWSKN
jgi:cell wall-associated NlpC family hydrolase